MTKIELYSQFDGIIESLSAFSLSIPWPPSAGAYAKKHGLTQKGRKYRQKLEALYRLERWRQYSMDADRSVFVGFDLYPPDFRIQSISEYLKAPIVELSYLGIIANPSRIECLLVRQRTVSSKNPMIDVTFASL